MFIRLKKINGQHYAYKVKNAWTQSGARQKSVKYLGKAVVLPPPDAMIFGSLPGDADYPRIVSSLIEWELLSRGFQKAEGSFAKEGMTLALKSHVPHVQEKPVVLKINDGYLCQETVQRILSFRRKDEEDHEQAGIRLANAFISAGIRIPPEVFVKAYDKVSYFEEPQVKAGIEDYQ
jgi:hypothetical protein